jgi:hypothetical protein
MIRQRLDSREGVTIDVTDWIIISIIETFAATGKLV